MSLTKGFLLKKHAFKPNNLFGALLLWILSSYILYAFLQLMREAFRLFTGTQGSKALVILTPEEHYLYNLFLAAIASAIGYAISLRFMLDNSMYNHGRRIKVLIRRTLNSEAFFTWWFLFWFLKIGIALWITYLAFAIQYDFDLMKEFPLILILLPIVVFYSTWPTFSRLIKADKSTWVIGLTGVFIVMSFSFSFKNFIDYKHINNQYLNHSIAHTFDLQVPVSQSQQRIFRSHRAMNIYLVLDTVGTQETAIFIELIDHRIQLLEFPKAIKDEKDKFYSWDQSRIHANLHIDNRIPMKQVKFIKNELRKAGIRRIQYSTSRKYSRYPSDYSFFRFLGIESPLAPIYYPQFESFLDSAEKIDLTNYSIELTDSYMYRNGALKGYNRIEISVFQDSVLLNGQVIDTTKLEQTVHGFIEKSSPNYVIIFNSEDNITYARYIEILDIICTQVDRLRNELSMQHYGKLYNEMYRIPEEKMIKMKMPRIILEWTKEEQRLNKLMKKVRRTNDH